MSNIPENLKYTEEHEWVKVDGDVLIVGITDHAQSALGDVVFLDLPEVGRMLSKGKAFGVVESVKAVSDLYAPVDGEVIEINKAIVEAPEGINKDPYGVAWMLKLKPSTPKDVDGLLSAAGYTALLSKIAK
ncbi:MAG: glycine cleavage system protein GcvH [Deltaproteobacteria bacterium]|nr:glycine cleavage system protein GcvH [Deltaproteobacteria bacterium]